MDGSATVVMSASSTTRNCVRQMTDKMTVLCAGARRAVSVAIESERARDHHAVQPPSTLRMWPVTLLRRVAREVAHRVGRRRRARPAAGGQAALEDLLAERRVLEVALRSAA